MEKEISEQKEKISLLIGLLMEMVKLLPRHSSDCCCRFQVHSEFCGCEMNKIREEWT